MTVDVSLYCIAQASRAEKLSRELYSFSLEAKVESTSCSSVDIMYIIRSLSHHYELLSQPFVIDPLLSLSHSNRQMFM
jgi:hypothetical protein